MDRSPLSEFLARGKESILSWGCFYDYLSLCSFQRTIFSNPSPNYDTVSEGEGIIRDSSGKGREGRKECILTLLSFVFMGMAGLTKGPVGVLFPLLIIFLFMLIQGQWKKLFQKEFILGYLVISFILGSWVIPFIHQAGWDNASEVWKETRILTRHAPFYLYGYRIWVDFAPWSIFLPSLLFYYWKKEKNGDEKYLILWFFGLFVLLALFPYKASKYLLPAFPALALLMGGFWKKWSLVPFLIIFFGTVLAWHGYEYSLIRKNHIRTPGLALHQALSPYQDKKILGYQMDVDVLGKINFYGDKLIPQVREVKDLKEKAKGKGEVYIITTETALTDLIKEGFPVTSLQTIDDRKESLVFIKIQEL